MGEPFRRVALSRPSWRTSIVRFVLPSPYARIPLAQVPPYVFDQGGTVPRHPWLRGAPGDPDGLAFAASLCCAVRGGGPTTSCPRAISFARLRGMSAISRNKSWRAVPKGRPKSAKLAHFNSSVLSYPPPTLASSSLRSLPTSSTREGRFLAIHGSGGLDSCAWAQSGQMAGPKSCVTKSTGRISRSRRVGALGRSSRPGRTSPASQRFFLHYPPPTLASGSLRSLPTSSTREGRFLAIHGSGGFRFSPVNSVGPARQRKTVGAVRSESPS